jgi:hypothetical protein
MDVLKEKLKRHKPETGAASRSATGAAEMEGGYLLMLRLWLDPRAAALRKASPIWEW